MKITDWLGNIFNKKKNHSIRLEDYRADLENKIALEAFGIFSVVEMISALIGKCEFKTYRNGIEIKEYNWYALNVKPNKNQNSTQFWQEYISRLLYFREALIINVDSQMIIADDFVKEEFAVRETIFTQVSRAGLTFRNQFRMSDVCYTKYTNADVKTAMGSIFGMYEQLIGSASEKYINAGGQKGVLKISAIAQNRQGFEEDFKKRMNEYFKTYFSSKNAVLTLWDGMDFIPSNTGSSKGTVSEITDVARLVEDSLARAAQAYRVPPAIVKGDVAGIKEAVDMMLTMCIDPLAGMISEELTSKFFSPDEVINGSYIEIDTSRIKHIDIFETAASVDKLIACGAFSVNEIRRLMGQTEINEEWADTHFITKNYETVANIPEGGEKR